MLGFFCEAEVTDYICFAQKTTALVLMPMPMMKGVELLCSPARPTSRRIIRSPSVLKQLIAGIGLGMNICMFLRMSARFSADIIHIYLFETCCR